MTNLSWVKCAGLSAAFAAFTGIHGYRAATFDMTEALAEREKSEFVTKACSDRLSINPLNAGNEMIDPAVLREKFAECVTKEAKAAVEKEASGYKWTIGQGVVFSLAGGAAAISAFRQKRKDKQEPA